MAIGNCVKNEPPSWVHIIDFLSPKTNVGYGSEMRKKMVDSQDDNRGR